MNDTGYSTCLKCEEWTDPPESTCPTCGSGQMVLGDGGTGRVPPLNMNPREALVLHSMLSREEPGEWETSDDGDAIRSLQTKVNRLKHAVDAEIDQ